MASPVVSNEMYVILGATGNTGSIAANVLLSKGKKVRVVGRDPGRLQRFVDKGAEAFTADMGEVAALTKALTTRFLDFWLLGGASLLVWLVMIAVQGFRGSWAIDQHFKNLTLSR